jgi:purine-binding chemotaxis protein CheW
MALGSNLRRKPDKPKKHPEKPTVPEQGLSVPTKTETLAVETPEPVGAEVILPDVGTTPLIPQLQRLKTGRKTSSVDGDTDKKETSRLFHFIMFTIGQDAYALPIDAVKEVVHCPRITPMPQVPDWVNGVANVRGTIYAIFDLAKKLNPQDESETSKHFLLVINHEEYKVAIAVESVPETLVCTAAELGDTTQMTQELGRNTALIKGIIRKNDRLIILLDILEMVSIEEFVNT